MRPARHAASRDHDLREFLAHAGEPAYRLTQLLHAVYRRGVTEFAHMDELPRRLRDQLAARYGESVLTIRPIATQRGPQVEKLLFELIGDAVAIHILRSRGDCHRQAQNCQPPSHAVL